MLLDEFERSGLSGPKFSEVAGVCYRLAEELKLAHLEIKLLKQKLDALARRL